MNVTPQAIPDVLLLEPKRHGDARGFFSEVWKAGVIPTTFVQDNHSLSREVNVLRGLHFQRPPTAQGKLVRVTRGRILDVAVDIRQGSATYGQVVACELSAENWRQLWVPPGFAHGFLTLEPDTEVVYKVDAFYDPATDAGIAWNDPALGIEWPLPPGGPILSEKDRRAPCLADIAPPFPAGWV